MMGKYDGQESMDFEIGTLWNYTFKIRQICEEETAPVAQCKMTK